MVIENEQLILIGTFIDTHAWLSRIVAVFTSFIVYFLYLGAVLKKWLLNYKEIIVVLCTIVLLQIIYEFDAVLFSTLSVISMFALPALLGAELKTTTIVFATHSLSQTLSISIRNLPMLLTNINFVTTFLLGLECYFWLLLFYLYYNYKKEDVNHG